MRKDPENIKQVIWLVVKWIIAIIILSLVFEIASPVLKKYRRFSYPYFIRR